MACGCRPFTNRPTIPVPSAQSVKRLFRKTGIGRRWNAARRALRRWRGGRWARRRLAATPAAVRIVVVAAAVVVAFSLVNLAYQVVRKPTELLFFVGGTLDKEPAATWREYGALFRAYSTPIATPELLAALAQVESSGSPATRTYWRWQLTFNPFAIYRPASSAVGLFQMTDAAFAEAARFCIRQHAVDTDCRFNALYIRSLPSHATELAAVYLDRNVVAVLARASDAKPSPQQTQDLAAVVHLCGAGPAAAFARRGFKVAAGERCGDHRVAGYLAQVNDFKRQFMRLATDGRS
jgi:hypothetical protein